MQPLGEWIVEQAKPLLPFDHGETGLFEQTLDTGEKADAMFLCCLGGLGAGVALVHIGQLYRSSGDLLDLFGK